VYPEWENEVILPFLPLELWPPCKARWVWAGAVIFVSAMCSLQFAKASAATLSQQERNNSADVQRGRVNISIIICTVAWPKPELCFKWAIFVLLLREKRAVFAIFPYEIHPTKTCFVRKKGEFKMDLFLYPPAPCPPWACSLLSVRWRASSCRSSKQVDNGQSGARSRAARSPPHVNHCNHFNLHCRSGGSGGSTITG
jgi:hypothetical protein